jgi:hypothetical protein
LERLGRADSPLETPVSFADFVQAVVGQTDLEMNPHWRVQSSNVLFDKIPYAFIGRFEHFNRDFAECFRVLGIPESDIPTLRHLNRTKAGTSENCGDYYTKELQDTVYARFRRDFDNFGYGYDLPESDPVSGSA